MSLIKTITVALFLSLVSQNYASAQTADTPTPTAEDYSTGKVVTDDFHLGDYYKKGQFGDWTLRCVENQGFKRPLPVVSIDAQRRQNTNR